MAGNLNDCDGPCGSYKPKCTRGGTYTLSRKESRSAYKLPNLAESGGMLLLMKGEHSNSEIIRWNNEL